MTYENVKALVELAQETALKSPEMTVEQATAIKTYTDLILELLAAQNEPQD